MSTYEKLARILIDSYWAANNAVTCQNSAMAQASYMLGMTEAFTKISTPVAVRKLYYDPIVTKARNAFTVKVAMQFPDDADHRQIVKELTGG